MRNALLPALIGALLLTAAALQAAAATAETQIEEASAPDTYVDPGMEIEDAFSRFFADGLGKQLHQRMAAGELYVGTAWAEIPVPPTNSQWGKYRVSAFDSAMTRAENNYLMALSARIKAGKIRKLFADNSGEVPEFDDAATANQGKIGKLVDKLLAVTGGKLDKELEGLGIDPQQYNQAPEPQRHQLFNDALTKSTVKEALGSLAGLVPVQTFEAHNRKGEHVIGVVVVASEKMRQFAHDIATRRGRFQPEEGGEQTPVRQRIAADTALLTDQFGIRRLTDEHGYPVLIAYGQWANGYQGSNPQQARRQRAAAIDQARANADHMIAMFIAGHAMVSESDNVGQLVEQYVDVHQDGYKEEQAVQRIIDEVNKRSEAHANITLSGLTDITTWTRPHPLYKDREVVGVVRMWSPLDERNMRALKDWKPNRQSSDQPPAAGDDGVRHGKAYMRADDF